MLACQQKAIISNYGSDWKSATNWIAPFNNSSSIALYNPYTLIGFFLSCDIRLV